MTHQKLLLTSNIIILWKKSLQLLWKQTHSCNFLRIYGKRSVSDCRYSLIMTWSILYTKKIPQTLKQLPPHLFCHPNLCLQQYKKQENTVLESYSVKIYKNFNLFHSLRTFILSFTDSSKVFTHAFISKMCHSKWVVLLNVEDWEPNRVCERPVIIRDWRGRCMTLYNSKQIRSESVINVHNIGVQLIQTENVSEQTIDEFNIRSAYISVCPVTEYLVGCD